MLVLNQLTNYAFGVRTKAAPVVKVVNRVEGRMFLTKQEVSPFMEVKGKRLVLKNLGGFFIAI